MRLYNISPILVTLLLASLHPLIGQVRTITADEFYTTRDVGVGRGKGIAQRRHSTEVGGKGKASELRRIDIFEFAPPDRERRYLSREQFGKKYESEEIRIGDKLYCNNDGKRWTGPRENRCFDHFPAPFKAFVTSFTVNESKLGDEAAILYTATSVSYPLATGDEYFEWKIWYRSDSLIIREEKRSGRLETRNIGTEIIVEYDYNPAVKIEAPIK